MQTNCIQINSDNNTDAQERGRERKEIISWSDQQTFQRRCERVSKGKERKSEEERESWEMVGEEKNAGQERRSWRVQKMRDNQQRKEAQRRSGRGVVSLQAEERGFFQRLVFRLSERAQSTLGFAKQLT